MKIQEFIESFREGSKSRQFVEILKYGTRVESSRIKEKMEYSKLSLISRQINEQNKGYKLYSEYANGRWFWQMKKDK